MRCGKRNQIIALKEDNALEELTFIDGLTASSLCSSSLVEGGPYPFFLGVQLCLVSVLTNSLSLCSPPCYGAVSKKETLNLHLQFLPPWKFHFFTGGKYPGSKSF